jgi:hypothetical protein
MKWLTPAQPKHGDKRRQKKFAWFPIKCDDGTTRWLETIYIEETWFQSKLWEDQHWWSHKKFISKDMK